MRRRARADLPPLPPSGPLPWPLYMSLENSNAAAMPPPATASRTRTRSSTCFVLFLRGNGMESSSNRSTSTTLTPPRPSVPDESQRRSPTAAGASRQLVRIGCTFSAVGATECIARGYGEDKVFAMVLRLCHRPRITFSTNQSLPTFAECYTRQGLIFFSFLFFSFLVAMTTCKNFILQVLCFRQIKNI
jgi:hypothetical protein